MSDVNQGVLQTMSPVKRDTRLLFSLIRTLTVGFGFSPNLLTFGFIFKPQSARGLTRF